MSETLHASPFHARAAELNRANAWLVKNGITLAAAYTGVNNEALAARTRVGMADISARWQVALEGPRVVELLQRLLTRDISALSPGTALKALWLNDQGGMRGAGVVARYGQESFRLTAFVADREWISQATDLFDVSFTEHAVTSGGLALSGPYARATLKAAGLLPSDLDVLAFRVLTWHGVEVTLARFGQQGGYELWCNADDALMAWDRIVQAGASFGLEPIGLTAADILDIEAGVPRPGRDFVPATDSEPPDPRALGLERLIDENHAFNGRAAYLARSSKKHPMLVGLEIDSDVPAPFTPLMRNGTVAGATLGACYSPALRRAIALAQVDQTLCQPRTPLSLTLPPSIDAPQLRIVTARVATLPFLPLPDSVPE